MRIHWTDLIMPIIMAFILLFGVWAVIDGMNYYGTDDPIEWCRRNKPRYNVSVDSKTRDCFTTYWGQCLWECG